MKMELPQGMDEREHSRKLDHDLGIRSAEIEASLYQSLKAKFPDGNHHTWWKETVDGHQTWVGLDPQTLQTPYSQIQEVCRNLEFKKNDLLVDLGAGYGRFGFMLHFLHPEVKFIGYEFVKERVDEGKRIYVKFNCHNAQIFEQDLTKDFVLPEAQFYFIYDYGHVSQIKQTLDEIGNLSANRNFKVIAWGKATRRIIDLHYPWLTQISEPKHFENYSIYSIA